MDHFKLNLCEHEKGATFWNEKKCIILIFDIIIGESGERGQGQTRIFSWIR